MTGYWVKSCFGAKILIGETDRSIQINTLVYGRKDLLSVYRSSNGLRQTVYDGYSELVGWLLSVSKLDGLGDFWDNWRCKLRQLFFWDILNFVRKDSTLVTLTY